MQATKLTETKDISATLYRCQAGPGDRPFDEQHDSWSIAFVRAGSFGYINRGRRFDLVPGSLLIGRPGDDFTCTHDHHEQGDECLCFRLAPQLVDEIGTEALALGAVAPMAEFMVLGALADAAVSGAGTVALDEVGVAIAGKLEKRAGSGRHDTTKISARERRRIVAAAHWIAEHAQEPIDLAQASRQSGFSTFHFLRLFAKVIGVTPHQYLIRARLARAARLLAETEQPITDIAFDIGFGDLSNFVRTFGRAAGLSPRDFRRAARADAETRKILQDRIARAA
ncbi:helix-turn-helix domain-containing protein [Dongia sp.]|uniref:AraC family transcriptional regulator n=1 Tax=Dongia sp. TaxID=1977262 RepID=UPI0035B045FD